MKWIIFNVACLLSLLLCVAVLALWFRSYRTADYLAYCQECSERGVISTVGEILIYNETAIEPFRWKAPFGFQRQAWRAPDSIFVCHAQCGAADELDGVWSHVGG